MCEKEANIVFTGEQVIYIPIIYNQYQNLPLLTFAVSLKYWTYFFLLYFLFSIIYLIMYKPIYPGSHKLNLLKADPSFCCGFKTFTETSPKSSVSKYQAWMESGSGCLSFGARLIDWVLWSSIPVWVRQLRTVSDNSLSDSHSQQVSCHEKFLPKVFKWDTKSAHALF